LYSLSLRPSNNAILEVGDFEQSSVSFDQDEEPGTQPVSPLPGSTFSLPVNGHTSRPNPEADSFLYMEGLLESLASLGKLKAAIDTVSQRISMEIHDLIENTIDEVDERFVFLPS
jgi:hypothetical protein